MKKKDTVTDIDVKSVEWAMTNFRLVDKLSDAERQKVRRMYKSALLSVGDLTSNAIIITLENLFGKSIFKDLVKLNNEQELFQNTPV